MASTNLIVGVLGNGEITAKTVKALLADRVSGTEARFIIPITEEHWTLPVRAAAWALNHKKPYDVILDGSESDLEAVEDVLEGAAATHKVTAVEAKLVNLLQDGSDDDTEGILLLAWNEDDDACQRALTRALKRDVKAYDLTDGLNDLKYDDDEPAAAPEPEPEPETKAKRTRRTKAEMEAARAAEVASVAAVDSANDEAQTDFQVSGSEARQALSEIAPATSNGNGHHPDATGVVEFIRELVKSAVKEALADR